jgi:hypothetical protein
MDEKFNGRKTVKWEILESGGESKTSWTPVNAVGTLLVYGVDMVDQERRRPRGE